MFTSRLKISSTTGAVDNEGTSFFLAFSQLDGNANNPELLFTTNSTLGVDVTVDTLRYNGYSHTIRFLTSGTPRIESLRTSIRIDGSGVSSKGIRVRSTGDVAVFGFNKHEYSADGFLALPEDALGTSYYAITDDPSDSQYPAQLTIVSTQECVVSIHLSSGPVQYRGRTYERGDVITETVKADQYTVQVQGDVDFSGTRVEANRRVAVFSGNVRGTVRPLDHNVTDHVEDHLVMQLPPLTAWGKTFVIVPLPERVGGDYIKIVAAEDDTKVLFSHGKTVNLQEGEIYSLLLPSREYHSITSTRAIQVAQFGRTQYGPDSGDATMILIPPLEQYKDEYQVNTPDSSFGSYINYALIVVRSGDRNNLTWNGKQITSFGADTWEYWSDVPGLVPSLLATRVRLGSSALHVFQCALSCSIIMYGYSDKESYGFPAGMNVDIINLG